MPMSSPSFECPDGTKGIWVDFGVLKLLKLRYAFSIGTWFAKPLARSRRTAGKAAFAPFHCVRHSLSTKIAPRATTTSPGLSPSRICARPSCSSPTRNCRRAVALAGGDPEGGEHLRLERAVGIGDFRAHHHSAGSDIGGGADRRDARLEQAIRQGRHLDLDVLADPRRR